MTFHNAFKSAKSWQRRVVLVSMYHNVRLAKSKQWKLVDTAKYFQISIGHASENIHLSEEYELIKDCSSRNAALKKIKK